MPVNQYNVRIMVEYNLKENEIAQYQRDGYVIPQFIFPPALLEKMQSAYQRLLDQNPALESDFILGPHLKSADLISDDSQAWFEFATYPPLLDIAEQLIGEDIILWGTTLFGKPAHSGKETPWHQDGDYYPIRPLETLTIWIALDDVTEENGPLEFIPGSHASRKTYSHHWQDGDHLTINMVCDHYHYDETLAEKLLLKAGQTSFHDVYMIHGSKANNTSHRRAAFIVRLMPAHCLYDHRLGDEIGKKHAAHGYGNRPLFLVRGVDRHGQNNFQIGHS